MKMRANLRPILAIGVGLLATAQAFGDRIPRPGGQEGRGWTLAHTLEGHDAGPVSLAFDPDGDLLASGGSDDTVILWDVARGESVRRLEGHSDTVRSLAFGPDGQILATGSDDGTLGIWDVGTGKRLHKLPAGAETILGLAFTPDGKTLVSLGGEIPGGGGPDPLRAWDVGTGKEARKLDVKSKKIGSMDLSPDGLWLAAACGKGDVHVVDTTTGQETRKIEAPVGSVSDLLFCDEGKSIALSGPLDEKIVVLDFKSGEHVRTLSTRLRSLFVYAVSPDGKLLAGADLGESIHLFDAQSGAPLQELPRNVKGTLALAFGPDGKHLAAAGGFGGEVVHLWRAPERAKEGSEEGEE